MAHSNPERAREYQRAWRAANPDKVRAHERKWYAGHKQEKLERNRNWRARNLKHSQQYDHAYQLRRTYGLSLEEYTRMLTDQKGCCAVCGKPDASGKRLHVDHDHESGRVRGLLCNACNLGIGKLGDTLAGVERAAQYLRGAHNG